MKPLEQIEDHKEAAAILNEEFAALGWNATNVTGGTLTTDGDKWQHYAWTVNFAPPYKAVVSLPYKCGTAHATKPKFGTPRPIPPNPAEVLASYCRDWHDSDCAFDEWAGNFGYDTDSRMALAVYDECRAIGPKLRELGLSYAQIERFAALSSML